MEVRTLCWGFSENYSKVKRTPCEQCSASTAVTVYWEKTFCVSVWLPQITLHTEGKLPENFWIVFPYSLFIDLEEELLETTHSEKAANRKVRKIPYVIWLGEVGEGSFSRDYARVVLVFHTFAGECSPLHSAGLSCNNIKSEVQKEHRADVVRMCLSWRGKG